MVEPQDHERLDSARRRAGLSVEALWIRYFELGGLASVIEVDAFLRGALVPARLERDVLAHAINEALVEKGVASALDYSFPAEPGLA
ncbi:MAG: hypothetical protein M3134_08065 [Actinomycetota bacterium]|nr:hypothetical protein [Actinomycetota bacterium]